MSQLSGWLLSLAERGRAGAWSAAAEVARHRGCYAPVTRSCVQVIEMSGLADQALTRRTFLAAGAAAISFPTFAWATRSARQSDQTGLRLELFPPTGRYSIGTVQLYLVDHSRRDPWLPSRPRELMVSVWYPARDHSGSAFAPWIQHRAGVLYLNQFISSLYQSVGPTPNHGNRVPLSGVELPITRARLRGPADLSGAPYPVVLYQPGLGDIRETGTGLVSDLASRGYVVVTMDDTYEAEVVEFPGGRLATTLPNQTHVGPARLADTRFVLDEMSRLRAGVNPDALHRKLPSGLGESLNMTKVGMFGHSMGGATAARAMAAEQRIHAGVDLDGSLFAKLRSNPNRDIAALAKRLARQLGRRPFMLMTSQGHDAQSDPSLAGFWEGLRGWRLFLSMRNSQHFTYMDLEEFLSQMLAAGIAPRYITEQIVTEFIGTVEPSRAVAAERAYITAFFDLQLRGRHSNLMTGPSPEYPEIEFLRH